MQARQAEVARQLESAPERRLRAVQVQTDPKSADLGRDREQPRRLLAPELLEDAGHLPAHQRVEERLALLRAGAGHQLLHQVLDVGRFGHQDSQSPPTAPGATPPFPKTTRRSRPVPVADPNIRGGLAR